MQKDVGEYADRIHARWPHLGVEAEPVRGQPIFEYERSEHSEPTGRGHLLAKLRFPGYPEAYLHVEDWLSPHRGHIRRDAYAYDLIYQGARLQHWHRHHGFEHRHVAASGERRPHKRVTMEEAIAECWQILESGLVPQD